MTLLPPAVAQFLRRRLAELGGAALLALGLATLLALASYHGADPSFNHAVARAPLNLLGVPGAYGADLLLQSLGLAAAPLAAMLVVWGWRLAAHQGLRRALLRTVLLAPMVLLGAIAFAALPTPASWPLASGLGGFAGSLALGRLLAMAQLADLSVAVRGLGFAMALPAAALFVYGLGYSWREWLGFARRLAWLATHGRRNATTRVSSGVGTGLGWLRSGAERLGARRGPVIEHGMERDADDAAEPTLGRAQRRRAGERVEPEFASSLDDEDGTEPGVRRDALGDLEIAPRAAATPQRKRASRAKQATLDLDTGEDYEIPPLDLLGLPADARPEVVDEQALAANARLLESVLEDFGVKGKIVKVRPGPVVTLYELEPAPGTKSARVISLADDIARSMSAVSVRVAVVPGRNVLGIELPNVRRETVYLRELLASEVYERTAAKLTLVLGKDIGGAPVIVDLARMPHLLVAGTTGSGKSVAINTMILSLLYRLPPSECRFIMIDPKMLELSVYDGIPHLLTEVVTEPKKAIVALKWTVREMENRYRAMSTLGVRNIAGYNLRLQEARRKGETLKRRVQTGFDAETGKPQFEEQPLDLAALPYIVVVVDEFADLMLVAGKEIEAAIQRLSQMARAAGIHLIMATQRPSVDVITGTIKANFPTRVSFQVTSRIDSRTILGESGAEQLLGQGDMLYMAGGGRISRVHGPFVRDDEVEAVVGFLKEQGEPNYIEDVTEDEEDGFAPGFDEGGGSGDELYDRAVALVCRERKASTSFVQRYLQIGYNRAARIIERMEAEGVVTPANHVGKREVLGRNIDDPDA
ncbi:MAG TPA: DNA translocase FtsK 4TM domain-containing protein [Alphaproteobacteria bacterium]|nr:DNA translocase FtsK 4TM domain-containing protein [Alphaproteobacteria bacterium]